MWTKFAILMFVALINLGLGILVLSKNKSKEKFIKYFALMCVSAGLLSFCIALASVTLNETIFLWLVKLSFISAVFIFIFFLLFSIEFPYKDKKVSKVFKYFVYLSTIFIFYIILSGKLFIGIYQYNSSLYEMEDKFFHLIYGLYFFILLIYSYYLLFLKYHKSQGVNRSRLMFVILGALIPFIFGIFFVWYVPHINKHYLLWIGPIFSIFMTLSIGYLLFKKH